jgi:hypothetical protein
VRGWIASLFVYVLFAAAVFLFHGAEPELTVDHIAYFKSAEQILAAHPDGDYWRSISSLNFYGVLLAYAYGLTGSHVASLKLMLGGMTVLYLLAFELLATVFVSDKRHRVLFSLLSAFFVSFGASFWGVTDFFASLHRTIVVPPMLVLLWAFLRFRDAWWRYLIYPALVLLSAAHLSTYYLLLILTVYEAWDFVVERRLSVDRRLAYFALGIVLAMFTRFALDAVHIGFSQYVDYALSQAVHCSPLTPEQCIPAAEAWEIERTAFPWRNMPLPVATVATIGLSYGLILLLTLAGLYRTWRGGFTWLDRAMLGFAVAVATASYGPQTLLWALRQFVPIYPVNFEEIRAINFIVLPSLHFIYRLFSSSVAARGMAGWLAVAIPVVVLLQPVVLLRALPAGVKVQLIETATSRGLIDRDDTLRKLYARQLLRLETHEPRFYYAMRGVLEWLEMNCKGSDRVLTDRNEVLLLKCSAVGPFVAMQGLAINTVARRSWQQEMRDVAAALRTSDMEEVRRAGAKYGATLAVVPWPVQEAVYRDELFSVVRLRD